MKKVFRTVKKTAACIFHWLLGLLGAVLGLWRAIGPKWLRRTLLAFILLVLGYFKIEKLVQPNIVRESSLHSVVYLNDSWSQEEREAYYYTPQGTELLGLPYDWLNNLELPLSEERLASTDNMRGWGFIVTPGQLQAPINPANFPLGFGRHLDPVTGEERLDIGCAACHTGELHYKGYALRVDGGQGLHSIPNAKRGEFITTLGAAVGETYFNPAKWDRFATRVVGQDKAARSTLRKDFWAFAKTLFHFTRTAGAAKYYPVEEGRGRTDAVGRIGNIVFGYDLDEPKNYNVADAPASYPFLWDIWRFDWVQYTGFTNQAMARNVGESLGVLAPIKLVDDEGNVLKGPEFGKTLVDVDGMHCVEGLLRKLKPPKWPEQVLGAIDIQKAKAGKALFADKCVSCHGPHISPAYEWAIADNPGESVPGQNNTNYDWDNAGIVEQKENSRVRLDQRAELWSVPWIDTKVIGTDSKLADNYIDNQYDPSKLVPGSPSVNAGDGLQLLLNVLVPELYRAWDVNSADLVASFDGLNVPFRIENKRAYKARPLHGVWATPPFLHNGSVPTIYHLLSPLNERPPQFHVGNRDYDPKKLGYTGIAGQGTFLMDTQIDGNRNSGHLFTDVESEGRIGNLLSEKERYELIEYIKVMGNPDFSERLDGDPLNWSQYNDAPEDSSLNEACKIAHSRHGVAYAH